MLSQSILRAVFSTLYFILNFIMFSLNVSICRDSFSATVHMARYPMKTWNNEACICTPGSQHTDKMKSS
jgi:hypothetical protein